MLAALLFGLSSHLFFSFFFLSSFLTSAAPVGSLYLTVAYCPTAFTGAGAIVKVDPIQGNFTIVHRFSWPEAIFGCIANYDPSTSFDVVDNRIMLDFTEQFGLLVEIDPIKGRVAKTVTPTDPFFVGFTNFWYVNPTTLKGLSPTVTQSGYCDDGCFSLGQLQLSGAYHTISTIPFRGAMDDSHFIDNATNTVYCQVSYPLASQRCSSNDPDLCLLAIDGTTGQVKDLKFTNYTVYKYSHFSTPSQDGMLAFVEGFDELCAHPDNNFLFARVNFSTAVATPIACIQRNETIHMNEWISSFSLDGSLLAQSSGDAEGTKSQLLVFDTATGKTVLETQLQGLPEKLLAFMKLIWVWSVDFVQE